MAAPAGKVKYSGGKRGGDSGRQQLVDPIVGSELSRAVRTPTPCVFDGILEIDGERVIRPGGNVEFIGPELQKLSRPDRCDERDFFMNAAINRLAKNGTSS